MSDQVGVVYVEVRPDARLWSQRVREQIRDQSVTIKADADTSEANAQLDEATRTRTVKIKTDVSQLSQGASVLDQFVGQLGLLPSLAIAAGSALVPLAAVMGGVVAAIGAPLAIAGGGATLFGLLAGAAVSQTQKQLKVIDSLQKKLDGATKGTAAYTQAQKDLRDAQKALTPEQTKFQSSISKLGAAFQNFLAGKSGAQLLSVVNQGIGLLIKLLPLAAPLISAAGGAFKTLLGQLSDGAGSKGFADFIHRLATQVGPDIVTFGHIGGNAIKGITGILTGLSDAFGGPHGGVLHGLEQLSGKFADLGSGAGHSKWLKDFVAYFHQVGPGVVSTLQSLGRAFGHIVQALTPLGPGVLGIVKGIADAFSGIPIGTLTELAKAAAQLVVFQKLGGFKVLAFATGRSAAAGGLLGAAGVTGAGGALGTRVFVTNFPPSLGGGGGVAAVPGAAGKGGLLGDAEVGAGLLGGAGLISRLPALLRGALSPVGLLTAGDIGNEVNGGRHALTPTAQQFQHGYAGSKTVPPASVLAQFNLNYNQARGLLGIAQIKSTTTAFDALRSNAQSASRQIDLIGPHAHQTFAAASADVAHFNGVLNSIHDQRFKVIADTADAIRSLEALQALRIRDKNFTVYQHYQAIEQAPGPFGGAGQNPHGSAPGTQPRSGYGGAGTGATHVHVHLDDGSGRTLHGVVTEGADQVYHANRSYERALAGQ